MPFTDVTLIIIIYQRKPPFSVFQFILGSFSNLICPEGCQLTYRASEHWRFSFIKETEFEDIDLIFDGIIGAGGFQIGGCPLLFYISRILITEPNVSPLKMMVFLTGSDNFDSNSLIFL